MAAFDIQSPTTPIPLRRSRDGIAIGEASFTVTNQTGRDVRVRVTPVAEGTTEPAWLDVARPGAERDLMKGASDTFIVLITVPAAAPPGDHTFRLDAVSVSLPDEEWGRGGSVVFHVPEQVVIDEPEREEEPGYIETVGGALLGAFVVAIVLLGVGIVVGLGAASGGGTGGTGGGDIGSIVGDIIGSAIGFAIVLLFIALAFAGLGIWLGPPIGAFLVLRFRGFPDPWLTALPMILLMPVLGLPIFIALSAVADAIGVGGAFGALWALFTGLIAISVPALASRAFARWRQTGTLAEVRRRPR